MRKRIFTSIIIVAITVLVASLSIATSFLYHYFNEMQINQLKSELALVADTVNDVGIEYFEKYDSTVFRFSVVSPDGTVLYDTQADVTQMGNHADREEIIEALASGNGSSSRNSLTMTKKTFYEAVLLEDGNVLRVSISQLTPGALILVMIPVLCIVLLITATVALFISYRMSKSVTEPLMNLDLDNPVQIKTFEELNPILTRLHVQHKQIKSQMDELNRKSDEFEQITLSMNEGLVLLDEHGMVLSMNKAARKIFGLSDESTVKDFLLIDRTDSMNKAVWRALSDAKRSEFTQTRDGRHYQFNINPIEADEKPLGAVILAFDITDKAFAERNRREFTANVSHELKTPLQSIIGSAELLETGLVKPEDTGRFVGNIKKEASRLVSLINDIIRLSQLDEQSEMPAETVDLYKVAGEVIDTLAMAAANKQIEITLTGESCEMKGVHRYLNEIIYNLCDNAIRYNKTGGKVNIYIKKEDKTIVLCVSDTGMGIPVEHQPRIYERFYRVDKSHSKETGGTGLGLSIVKHAVAYHGGAISLDSKVGEGTTITIKFQSEGLV